MSESNILRENIIKILKESKEPLGPKAFEEKLKIKRNLVHYHLTKLVKEERVISSNGKYSINKDKMEIIRELEYEILYLLSSEEYYPKELHQKLGHDENEIISALGLLEIYELIQEGKISLDKRGGIPKKGLTIHDSNYCRNSTYTPTYLGYSKIGYCPICKEELEDYQSIFIAFFKSQDYFKSQSWRSVKIHSKCIPYSKAYKETFGEYEISIFCHYCGLPLSPKTLPTRPITYEIIKDNFLSIELESIRLLEGLDKNWIVTLDIPIPGIKIASTPQNSTIEKIYNELEIKMPDWVSKRIKDDEIEIKRGHFEDMSGEIFNDIKIFDADISELKNAENLIHILMKYRIDYPEDYNIESRIKDVWAAAQENKKTYDKNIYTCYEKLIGPQAYLYSCIDWATESENYDFGRIKSDNIYKSDSPIFTQTFAIKCGDNYFHAYCAEKCGLSTSHCNDNNSKGGENIGEKIRYDR